MTIHINDPAAQADIERHCRKLCAFYGQDPDGAYWGAHPQHPTLARKYFAWQSHRPLVEALIGLGSLPVEAQAG